MKLKKWTLEMLVEKQVAKVISEIGPQIQAMVKTAVSAEIKTLEALMNKQIAKEIAEQLKPSASVTEIKK